MHIVRLCVISTVEVELLHVAILEFHHGTSQLGFKGVWVVTFMWYSGIPQAAPGEYHCTTLRVQYPYTLETHSTTITYPLDCGY